MSLLRGGALIEAVAFKWGGTGRQLSTHSLQEKERTPKKNLLSHLNL
jgi:hypothetical protein